MPGARSSGWNTALKFLAVGGCRLDADPHRAARDLFLHAPDDISSWRTVVERTARQNPEAVQPRVLPVGCRNHLGYAVSVFTAQASLPVGGAAPG
jgi:hypothetical protein